VANPGDILRDRYQIVRELGRGGMAEVYLAADLYEQRNVAIKLTSLELFDDAEIGARTKKLWLNETRLAGRLRHPHIVAIYEAGTTESHAYLVMEYVDGESLQRRTAADALLAVPAVAEAVFKVGNALDYASKLGMLHRDIKPANVLMSAQGAVKVTDFGACYLADVEDTQVYDVGTLPFMPPEHFENRPPSVQTDIYAVGVMAYQLLTGGWPFRGTTFQALIHEKLHEDFVPLEARRTDLPGALRFVVHRAMHRNCEMRYSSWGEFCDELSRAVPVEELPREIAFDSARFNALRRMAAFQGFSDAQVWETVHMSRWAEKRAGERLFSEGDPGDRLFVVVNGGVEIVRDGRRLNLLEDGECFGEIAYLDETRPARSASAVAHADTVLLEIDTESLRSASESLQAAFLRAFVRILIGRLRHADARFLESLAGAR
jgi:serine/threonine protein kinase